MSGSQDHLGRPKGARFIIGFSNLTFQLVVGDSPTRETIEVGRNPIITTYILWIETSILSLSIDDLK